MDYIDRLTELRQDKDIRQKEIANILNVKQGAVSKYELKQRDLKINDLIKLCLYYHVSADYILGLPEGLPYPKR